MFNWVGTLANMGVGFFFAPFILHRLGDAAYGVWVLAISVVGYLGLLDLGMQSSVLRFVSKGHTTGDHQGSSDAISAALWVRLQLSSVGLLLSAGLAAVFPIWFKVPPVLASDARRAILLIGLTTAIAMTFGVASAVLSGLNRYDLQNYVGLTQTAVRVTGIVIVLRTGHGIVAIAVCELIATMISSVLLVFYRTPPLPLNSGTAAEAKERDAPEALGLQLLRFSDDDCSPTGLPGGQSRCRCVRLGNCGYLLRYRELTLSIRQPDRRLDRWDIRPCCKYL